MTRNETKSLISQLRDLPPPEIPPGLEERLLAALPTPERVMRRRWRIVGWSAAVAAAAAGIVVGVALLQDRTPARTTIVRRSDVSSELVMGTAAKRAQARTETRSCDILPLLPF